MQNWSEENACTAFRPCNGHYVFTDYFYLFIVSEILHVTLIQKRNWTPRECFLLDKERRACLKLQEKWGSKVLVALGEFIDSICKKYI